MSSRIKFDEKIFWYKHGNQIKISPSKLIEFLSKHGYAKLLISNNEYLLVRVRRNIISEIKEFRISNFIQLYLKFNRLNDVYEVFVKGMSSYITKSRLELLKSIKLKMDKDDKSNSRFFFKSKFYRVTIEKITEHSLLELKRPIWDRRILNYEINTPKDLKKSIFEQFCLLVSGKEEERLLSLKSTIGYLLHRYYDPTNTKAVILVDGNLSRDKEANGGTGKGIIATALGFCREIVLMDGKNYNSASSFKFQRVERTTDILFFDDVKSDFNLEILYSMITSGIQIEKKYQQQLHMPPSESPKILISSNYMVEGTGGSTDRRRRFEFELSDYFNDKYTPQDEFGHMFFEEWEMEEWNKFFHFMMNCVQVYLKQGLIEAKPINLLKNKLINATCSEFEEFISLNVEVNKRIDKRSLLDSFKLEYPNLSYLSPHKFSKYLQSYASIFEFEYESISSAGNYYFIFKASE